MKSTFKVLFYLKKDKISKDGKVPVMGRITVNGTQAGFSCKLNIDPALWDEKTNYLKSQRDITHGCSQTDIAARQRLSNAPRR